MADELEPMAKVWVAFEIPIKDLDLAAKALGGLATTETLKFGQGEFDFIDDMDKGAFKEAIQVEAAKRFYDLYYRAKNPSPLMATVLNEISSLLPEDEKKVDRKGKLEEISRAGWDREYKKIVNGESSLTYRPGSERRKLADAFNDYLNPVEKAKKQKKTKKEKRK
jgi:hypothetical protein